MPADQSVTPRPFATRADAEAFMRTDEARGRFDAARIDVIRADERRRIVAALRHHGHPGGGTGFYEAADFIERRLTSASDQRQQ